MNTQRTSYSALSLFKSCRRAYKLRYLDRLEPLKVGAALRLGRMVHNGIAWSLALEGKPSRDGTTAALLASLSTDEKADMNPDQWDELLLASSMVYWWNQKIRGAVHFVMATDEGLVIERPFEVPCGHARRLVGVWDSIINYRDQWWIFEHKTTSSYGPDFLNNLLRDEQATAYVYAAEKVFGVPIAGVLYDIIEKPQLRLKKSETHEEFQERRHEWLGSDEDPRYHLQEILRTREQLDGFERDLRAVMADLRKAERDDAWYPSPKSCTGRFYTCEFASICPLDSPEAREGLYRLRPDRHEEEEDGA